MLLAVMEFMLMLAPANQVFVGVKEELGVWATLITIYLMGMTFSWYPGRP